MRNHYSTLGLTQKASQSEVVSAFKKLAKKYHPDKNPSSTAKERFIELHEAYSTLKDPTRRYQYDKSLTVRRTAGTIEKDLPYEMGDPIGDTKPSVKNVFGVSIVIAGSFLGVVFTALLGALIIALPVVLFLFIKMGSIPQRMLVLVALALPYWYGLYWYFLKRGK
jgi:hypothetical protein